MESLVVGGKLLEELDRGSPVFRKMGKGSRRAGKMIRMSDSEVNARVEELRREVDVQVQMIHIFLPWLK